MLAMLLSLLLANIRFLLCFFLDIFNNVLVISVVREKNKVKLALAIQTGAPAIVVNEIIDTPSLAALKTIKT